jgi:hypothetical protein
MASALTLLVQGYVPGEITNLLRANELVAIPKSNNDVRPIGIGSCLRKIASKCAFNSISREFQRQHFAGKQYVMERQGMETILHSLMCKREVNPHWDLFAIDADNALNSANRMVGLLEVSKRVKVLLPLMRAMYLGNSDGWYLGPEGGNEAVLSQAGYHQGDVLATWMYIIIIQPKWPGTTLAAKVSPSSWF